MRGPGSRWGEETQGGYWCRGEGGQEDSCWDGLLGSPGVRRPLGCAVRRGPWA